MSFRAVVTTGIYCRSGCSGRPLERNVRLYELAAAAEAAGFRPCRVCHPERAPGPASDGKPELVCRVLRAIADGMLDDCDEERFAERFAISARHLRRLFLEHVGATPAAIARSRRAHLARRLLDDTDLSIIDIAFAAGFRSLRQMNRTMREIFHAAPSQLRKHRGRRDRFVADGGLELRLAYRPPLDWEEALRQRAELAIPGVESITFDGRKGSVYRRTIDVDGLPSVLEARNEPGRSQLRLRLHLPNLRTLSHIVARVRRIFDLDADPHAHASRFHGGCAGTASAVARNVGSWSALEGGAMAILSQRANPESTANQLRRFVEVCGIPVAGLEPWGLKFLFPNPEHVSDADLTLAGISSTRAATVQAFARQLTHGALVLDGTQTYETTLAQLLEVPGIGPTTAGEIARRCCCAPAELAQLRVA